jgi:soluble lytic murein transglycosylase-like protein
MDRKTLIVAAGILLIMGLFFVPRKVWAMPARANPYAADIAAAEFSNDLPPQLLARLLYQESRYRQDIISGEIQSSAGALGIAQIVPRWHPGVDPLNPQDSIFYAAGYLSRLFNQYGSWYRALAAYNWGPGNVTNAINDYGDNWLVHAPTETQNYVTEILNDVEVQTA